MIPKTYDEFIINNLSIANQELHSKITVFAEENGVGVETLNQKAIIEKCLYEYGITNAEIKNVFIQYLGLEAYYFNEKYGNDAALLPQLCEHGLISMACKSPNSILYDAEFYFSDIKFQKAVQIYKKYAATA